MCGAGTDNPKYCGRKCAADARRELERRRHHTRRAPREERCCNECGEVFSPAAHNHWVCSDVCRLRKRERQHKLSALKAFEPEPGECAWCETKFERTKQSRTLTCSEECRRARAAHMAAKNRRASRERRARKAKSAYAGRSDGLDELREAVKTMRAEEFSKDKKKW